MISNTDCEGEKIFPAGNEARGPSGVPNSVSDHYTKEPGQKAVCQRSQWPKVMRQYITPPPGWANVHYKGRCNGAGTPTPKNIITQKCSSITEKSKMLTVKNMSFKTGHEMKITGKATSPTGFSINIGHSEESVALHFNPRFSLSTIVCNSKKGGAWQAETRDSSFPFHANEEFKMSIQFTGDSFNIKLPNGHSIRFPNRFGDSKFKHIHVAGDVKIYSFKIK